LEQHRLQLHVCAGTGCVANQSFAIQEELKKEIAGRGLQDEVKVTATGCQGFCEAGPIVIVQPDDVVYQKVHLKDIPLMVEEHLIKGRPVKKLLYVPPSKKPPVQKMMDLGFFKHQRLLVLRNRGRLDPNYEALTSGR